MNSEVIWFLGICGTIFTALFSCAYKEPDFYGGYIADRLFKIIFFLSIFTLLTFGIVQSFSEHAIRRLEKVPEAAKAVAAVWDKWHTAFLVIGLFLSVMFICWCFLEWISKIRKTYLISSQKRT